MPARLVISDNLGTEMAPVERKRIYTPLTPRAVRNEIVSAAMQEPEGNREAWIRARLTPLDRLVTTEEADALESYALCVLILAGSARCGDYTGDRVQTSRTDMSPLPDKWLTSLARHQRLRLSGMERSMLATFSTQMNDDNAPSDAEAAIRHGVPGRDRRAAWADALARVAGALV